VKITLLGTGYVGLVTGACLAHSGHQVTCCDVDLAKIQRLQAGDIPFYEVGLADLVRTCVVQQALRFSDRLADAVSEDTDTVFLAVPTPQSAQGHADLRFIDGAVSQLIAYFEQYPRQRDCVIVTKSTVSVGTTGRIAERIKAAGLPHVFVANNPEFLREGSAVSDFMTPDRIVIGCDAERVSRHMQVVYRPFLERGVPLIGVGYAASELIKYASNTFLAAKVAFINEMAVLSEAVGANVQDIAKGMGLDPRIGGAFLNAGPGYGGSCFPKDVEALAAIGREYSVSLPLVASVSASNQGHKAWVFKKIIRILGATGGGAPENKNIFSAEPKILAGKKITVLGVAFKANTDDIRESVAITVVQQLVDAGAHVTVFDPEAMANAQTVLGDTVTYAPDPVTALTHADVGVVMTEWAAFQTMDLGRVREVMATPTLIDMRYLWDIATMQSLGFTYFPIGTAL
jgi:UDPglucose 6-dehydrogenase